MFHEGLLVVISGPSGTGKGTVLGLLRQSTPNIVFSVSATTRAPREGEIDGINYFFKTVDEFKAMIEADEMVEWVNYCNNYYGTPKKFVDECKQQGNNVLLEVEVEGALNIKRKYPDSVLIFIVPPSFEELRRRITGRGTENPEVISQRLEQAKVELKFIDRYDYVVVNNTLKQAVEDINSILKAEKLKTSRNSRIIEHLDFKDA
ncbi:MAG: guanylate kinase [Clostridia bacterium]|nr:guanylate kinase [Clostridia bacterium]